MSYNSSNVFAKIIRGEIPCTKVYEDTQTLAFHDIQPVAPVHVVVVPKADYRSFQDFMNHDAAIIGHFFQTVRNIAEQEGLVAGGYRIVTNHGADAGQSVEHFHVHILGGGNLGGLVAA